MPLMPTLEEVFNRGLNTFVESGEVTEQAGVFFSAVGASIFILATQIDLLHNELIAKGIEVTP